MTMIRWAPLALLLTAAPALADPAPLASEHRLSPAQIEATLKAAADQRLTAERTTGAPPVDVLDPLRGPAAAPIDLHGSLGVSIGTRGHRSAYGSAVLGLGGTTSVGITLHRSEGERARDRWIAP